MSRIGFTVAVIGNHRSGCRGVGATVVRLAEARTGRLLPGEGVLPLEELVAALPAVPLAIEAPCRATAELLAVERAKRAYRTLSALVSRED